MSKVWTEDLFADPEGDEPGITRMQFAAALSVWSWMQQRDVNLTEAAARFNVPLATVADAVRDHPYMELVGPEGEPSLQFIEHDGE